MPIRQSRLLALIEAGEHFRDTSLTIQAIFKAKSAAIFARQITIEQAFADLTLDLNTATHADAAATRVLSEERVRYNLTWKRNSVERRRLHNKRHPEADSLDTNGLHEPLTLKLPRRSIAEVAAIVDADDEALDGLAGIAEPDTRPQASPPVEPPPPPDPSLDPMAHDPAYLAWKAHQRHSPDTSSES